MKRLNFVLPMLAIVIAIAASAFTLKPKVDKETNLQPLYWFDASGTVYQNRIATVEEQMDYTSCDGNTTLCERGYTQSQLEGGNPNNGVKEEEIDEQVGELFEH